METAYVEYLARNLQGIFFPRSQVLLLKISWPWSHTLVLINIFHLNQCLQPPVWTVARISQWHHKQISCFFSLGHALSQGPACSRILLSWNIFSVLLKALGELSLFKVCSDVVQPWNLRSDLWKTKKQQEELKWVSPCLDVDLRHQSQSKLCHSFACVCVLPIPGRVLPLLNPLSSLAWDLHSLYILAWLGCSSSPHQTCSATARLCPLLGGLAVTLNSPSSLEALVYFTGVKYIISYSIYFISVLYENQYPILLAIFWFTNGKKCILKKIYYNELCPEF